MMSSDMVDTVTAVFSVITGLAGLLIAGHVWRSDRRKDEERQARLISAWVVREGRSTPRPDADEVRGIVICNGSDAPVSEVAVRVEEAATDSAPDSGQMFAQVPPGTYYVQRNDNPDSPWTAPFVVDAAEGGLAVTLEGERIPLVAVTEVPPEFSLAFLSFTDTFGTRWWRLGSGALTQTPPSDWNPNELRQTARRTLEQPRRGRRDAKTDAVATLLRAAVNLVVAPEHRVDLTAPPIRLDVTTDGSRHPLCTHIKAFGLSGRTGMHLRLLTDAGRRDEDLYFLEGSREGRLPQQFFFGRVTPNVREVDLRDELVSLGHSRASDWTPESLVAALTNVVRHHQAELAEGIKR